MNIQNLILNSLEAAGYQLISREVEKVWNIDKHATPVVSYLYTQTSNGSNQIIQVDVRGTDLEIRDISPEIDQDMEMCERCTSSGLIKRTDEECDECRILRQKM